MPQPSYITITERQRSFLTHLQILQTSHDHRHSPKPPCSQTLGLFLSSLRKGCTTARTWGGVQLRARGRGDFLLGFLFPNTEYETRLRCPPGPSVAGLSVHLCGIPLLRPLAWIWAASVLSMERVCHSGRLMKERVASSELLGERRTQRSSWMTYPTWRNRIQHWERAMASLETPGWKGSSESPGVEHEIPHSRKGLRWAEEP